MRSFNDVIKASLTNEKTRVKLELLCYNTNMKFHPWAGLASLLITGLGQIIKGESDQGVMLLLLFYFVLPAIIYTSLMFAGILFPYILGFSIIFAIILWLYNIWDALARQ